MKTLPACLVLVLVSAIAGCGGGYTPPPGGNSNIPSGGGTGADTPTNPKQSYANEYNAATRKALASWGAYRKGSKTAESYALAGAHIYDALRYRAMHTRNGHSADKLPSYRELNEASKEWRSDNARAPEGWEKNETYKEAFAAYQAVQSE
jgi:hypothetical protein